MGALDKYSTTIGEGRISPTIEDSGVNNEDRMDVKHLHIHLK